MGLDEIKKLQSEVMKVVREELKMPNVTFTEFFEMLKNDKNQEFTSENEVMEYFTKIIRWDLNILIFVLSMTVNDFIYYQEFNINTK